MKKLLLSLLSALSVIVLLITFTVTSSHAQPYLVLPGNLSDLINTDGLVRIGNNTFHFEIGVAENGGGAGTTRLQADGTPSFRGKMHIGADGFDVLRVRTEGDITTEPFFPNLAVDVVRRYVDLGVEFSYDEIALEPFIENVGQASVSSSLGTSARRWDIGYINAVIAQFTSSFATIIPRSNNTYSLGSSSSAWTTVYTSNGMVTTSDRRAKKNIKNLEYGLHEILQLKPVRYELKDKDRGKQKLGLIAQDVEKILKEVVSVPTAEELQDNEEARWGIYYADLIPVLIKGIQEQEAAIQEKNQEIQELKERLTQIEQALSLNKVTNSNAPTILNAPAILKKNQPNPFTENTTIEYHIPEGASTAQLRITDLKGKVIKVMTLKGTGAGQVQLKSGTLGAGSYFYSLTIDGQIVDTKQMMLTK